MYTHAAAYSDERRRARRGEGVLPRSWWYQLFLDVIGSPFALSGMGIILFCISIERILLPIYAARNSGAKNVSHSSASGTARWVAQARALYWEFGFGPDYLATQLVFERCAFNSQSSRLAALVSFHTTVWYLKFFKRDLMAVVERRAPFNMVQVSGNEQKKRDVENVHGFTGFDMGTTMHIRTCYFDDVVESFLDENAGSSSSVQIVILGAGFDSRCYRFAQRERREKRLLSPDISWFEADTSGTQCAKVKMLVEKSVDISHVKYVSVDFSAPKEGWVGALAEAGLDFSLKSLLIWEGVTMYLSSESVEDTLRGVSENFAPYSKIAFDYLPSEVVFNKKVQAIMKAVGEPWNFGLPAPGLLPVEEADRHVQDLVDSQGLSLVEHFWDLDEAKLRYLPLHAGESTVGFASKTHSPGRCVAEVPYRN